MKQTGKAYTETGMLLVDKSEKLFGKPKTPQISNVCCVCLDYVERKFISCIIYSFPLPYTGGSLKKEFHFYSLTCTFSNFR
jgi:hypothetical protein